VLCRQFTCGFAKRATAHGPNGKKLRGDDSHTFYAALSKNPAKTVDRRLDWLGVRFMDLIQIQSGHVSAIQCNDSPARSQGQWLQVVRTFYEKKEDSKLINGIKKEQPKKPPQNAIVGDLKT